MRCQVLAVLGLVGAAAAKPCSPVYPSSITAGQTNTAVSAVTSSSSAAASDSASASGSASGSVSADASASASASASGSASESASGSVSADASASSAADVSSILSSVVISSTVSVSADASYYTVSSDAASSTGSVASDYSSGAASSDASSISVAASTDVSSSDAASSTEAYSSAASSDASSAASSDASAAASSTEASSAASSAASSDGSSISVAASTDVSSSAAASTDGPSSVVPSTTAASSTESAVSSSASASSTAAVTVESIDSTVLIIARDEEGASSGASGLISYGIQFQKLVVPQEGAPLPTLNVGGKGNYAAIIIVDAVSYQYTDGWRSAITTEQWDTIHKYQTDFHVRMVRINEFPGPAFGATLDGAGGCCDAGVEQLISFSDVSDFPTANLKTGEGITSQGLYHYPSVITDTATTKAVAKFAAGGPQTGETVAAVINNFEGREQFVWFTSWAPTWSATSNYLQHAHIHWMTRGVFLGKRKVHLSAQIDDVQLETELFYPAGEIFKINTQDLEGHVAWQQDINSRLPAGSDFWLELAHNGNGDIEAATTPDGSNGVCNPDYAVWYDEAPDTPLEFQKPLGTGVDQWPVEFQTYGWSATCAQRDPFAVWFQTPANLNAFAHLSHTFTHLALNNATYKDAEREIQFNQAWFKQMGIDQAERWSAHGLVPPAITGLHNGDVINAWITNGITNVVGDNTRPVLRNTESQYWPLISNVENNGFAGLTIVPRFATTIYFNCDTAECTTREWIQTSGGSGDFNNLLAQAKSENSRYLFGLHADPYMFHQANMRQHDQPEITVGSQTGKFSIVSAWVEVVAQEVTRLTNWPITSLKHDDIAKYFTDRMALDKCKPTLSFGYAADGKSITSVTVGAEGNTCSVPVPVTIPSGSVSGGSVVADQVGAEPPIQWVTLSGSPVTLSLGSPVAVAA